MTEPESTAEETTGVEVDALETETETAAETETETGPRRTLLSRVRHRPALVITAGLLMLSLIVTGAVGWFVARPDRLTNPDARADLLEAAREGAEAVLTYSPESVDKNVADAKSHLTGEFLTKYTDFADKVVTPAAKQRGIKTEANVARAAVSQMHPDSAQVLAFVNQVTTSKERPTPALSTSSVMMTLVRRDGHWLISEFNPV